MQHTAHSTQHTAHSAQAQRLSGNSISSFPHSIIFSFSPNKRAKDEKPKEKHQELIHLKEKTIIMKKILLKTIKLNIALSFMLCAINSLSQPAGNLDPSFGTSGKVITSITNGQDIAYGVALQTDEKIIVAGYSSSSITGKDFTCVRYNTYGTLDNTFGTGGIVTTDLQIGSDDIAYSVALQTDGKIILAGYSDDGSNKDAALVRYNTNGSLDTSFGNSGIILTDFANALEDEIHVVKIHQLTGKIIVGGVAMTSSISSGSIIARYLSNGNKDSTFSSDGIFSYGIGGGTGLAPIEDLAVQANGKITATGWTDFPTIQFMQNYLVFRINNDGTLDNTFAGDGRETYDGTLSGNDKAYCMLLESNNNIIMAGGGDIGNITFDFTAYEINSDGTTSGWGTEVHFGAFDDENIAYGVAKDNTGKYVLAGSSGDLTSSAFALLRINPDATSDNTFGTGGKVTTTFGNALNECFAIAIQSDNKIVAVGYTGNDFAIARYLGNVTAQLNNFQLVSPANQSTNQNYSNLSFDWSDAFGATGYELSISINSNFTGSPQTYNVTTSSKTVSNLSPSTQYYWRVRATDGTNWGQYIGVWSFTTNALDNFQLVSPANQSTNQNYSNLTFDWTDAIGAATYELIIDVNQTFTGTPQTYNVTVSSKTLNNLLSDTQYYWKVRASDGTNWGSYSNIWSFTTNTLDNFSLIAPANNATNQPYDTLIFDWTDAIGASSYELEIDVSPSFSNHWVFPTTSSTIELIDFTPSTDYYWHVRASDGTSWGQWSAVWKFTLKEGAVSIEEISIVDLKIYPNPAQQEIKIEVKQTQLDSKYFIFDITGKQVISGDLNSPLTSVRLNKLASGLYFLQAPELSNQLLKIVKK